MSRIEIKRNPDEKELKELQVEEWPVWTKEQSEFPWRYDTEEMCYVLEGRVTVTPDEGSPVEIREGDLVRFPKGMSCTWKVKEPIRKRYHFPG